MHGAGALTTAAAGSYVGAFARNRFHGWGTLRAPDGSVYEGDFVEHRFHGTGRIAEAGGAVYEGTLAAGLRCGTGVCRYPDGSIYEVRAPELLLPCSKRAREHLLAAHALPDAMTGPSMHVRCRTTRPQGEWRDGKPCGQGVLVSGGWAPVTHLGEFVNGRPAVLPTKLNVSYTVSAGALAEAAAGAAAAGPGAAGKRGSTSGGGARAGSGGSKAAVARGQQKEDAAAVAGGSRRLSAAGGGDGPAQLQQPAPQGWVQSEAAAPVQATVGQPFPVELIVAAQEAAGLEHLPGAAAQTATTLGALPGDAGDPAGPPTAGHAQPRAQSTAGGAKGRGQQRSTAAGSSSGGAAGAATPSAKAASAATPAPAFAPAEESASPRTYYFELPPTPGRCWRTAETEFGRRVLLTLQRQPPQPLAPGRCLSVLLCCVPPDAADGDGSGSSEAAADDAPKFSGAVRVQLHISMVSLDPNCASWTLERPPASYTAASPSPQTLQSTCSIGPALLAATAALSVLFPTGPQTCTPLRPPRPRSSRRPRQSRWMHWCPLAAFWCPAAHRRQVCRRRRRHLAQPPRQRPCQRPQLPRHQARPRRQRALCGHRRQASSSSSSRPRRRRRSKQRRLRRTLLPRPLRQLPPQQLRRRALSGLRERRSRCQRERPACTG
jgi:hypothetical protein